MVQNTQEEGLKVLKSYDKIKTIFGADFTTQP